MSILLGFHVFAGVLCGLTSLKEKCSGIDAILITFAAVNMGIAAGMVY